MFSFFNFFVSKSFISHTALALTFLTLLFAESSFAQNSNETIQGEWTTDCLPIGKNGRHGYVTRVTITEDKIKATAQIYAKNTCQTPTVQSNFSGTILSQQIAQGQFNLEITLNTLTFTPNNTNVADHYNKVTKDQAGCGITGWQENIPMSVAGKTCGPVTFASSAARLYDAAWIKENQLRFGAFPSFWGNTTEDKRPASPSEIIYYRTGK